MKIKYIKDNIYFIAPVFIWLVFYGVCIISPGTFINLFIMLLLLGITPYIILWSIASRFPDKAGSCQIVSIAIFIITALLGIKIFFFSHNAEEAIGFFLLPVFTLGLIWYLILLLPLVAIIIYIRRRLKRKTEPEAESHR